MFKRILFPRVLAQSRLFTAVCVLISFAPYDLWAQGTAFNYQGSLQSGSQSGNGRYDFTFTLYNAPTNGVIVAGPVTNAALSVVNGLFTATLDFGSALYVSNAWIEIAVQSNSSPPWVTLVPRQPVTPVPLALTAANAQNLLGVLPVSQLPASIVTNGAFGVTLNGVFSGDGGGLTNLQAAALPASLQALSTNNGGGLTNLNIGQLSGGVLPAGVLPPQLATLNNGDGGGLTNLQAAALPASLQALSTNNGVGLTNLNISQLSGGVLPAGVLPPQLAILNNGDGGGLTNLNASQVTSGKLASPVLPTALSILNNGDGGGLTNLQAAALPVSLQSLSTNNGAGLTNLNAAQFARGVLPTSVLPPLLASLNNGDGYGLTNIPASALPASLQALSANNGVGLTNVPLAGLTGVLGLTNGLAGTNYAQAAARTATVGLAGTNATFTFHRAPVLTRAYHGGWFQANETSSQVSDGVSTNGVFIYRHQATTTSRNLQFLYGNSSIDRPGANPITLKASIQDQSGIYPIYFAGQRTVTLQPGQFVLSDMLPLSITNQEVLHSRTMVSVAPGGTWMEGQVYQLPDEGGLLNQGDVVDTVNAPGNLGYGYLPFAVYGDVPVALPVVAFIGDSIFSDYSAILSPSTNSLYDQPYVQQAFGPGTNFGSGIPHIQLSMQGDSLNVFVNASNRLMRTLLWQGANYAIVGLGVNDVPGYTLPEMQANATAVWQIFAASGIKVWATTLTPHTTSTDNWATLSNQTPLASESVRVGFNNWVRTTPYPLAGYFEVADKAESSRNSGLWNTNYTLDGLHPKGAAAAVALASAISTNAFSTPLALSSTVIFPAALGNNFYGAFAGSGALLSNIPLAGVTGLTSLTNGFVGTNYVASTAAAAAGAATNVLAGLVLQRANNLNDVASARMAASNVGVALASPVGGHNGYMDLAALTPKFEGQIALGYWGSKEPVVGFAGSTATGDWAHAFLFAYGIAAIGSGGVDDGTHAANGIYPDPYVPSLPKWALNGGPSGWAAGGDAGLVLENYSTNANQSGVFVGPGLMAQDSTTHLMFDLDPVGLSLAHVPTNKIAAIDPGYGGVIWNTHAFGADSNMLGLVFATPGFQLNGGNVPYLVLDSQAGLFRVPYWGKGTTNYTPLTGLGARNAAWGDSLLVNPATGNVWVTNTIFSATNNTSLLQMGNLREYSYGYGGGDLAVQDNLGNTFLDASKFYGIRMWGATNVLSWLNGSQIANLSDGNILVEDSTGLPGTWLGKFRGNGSGLTNLPAATAIAGVLPPENIPGTNDTSKAPIISPVFQGVVTGNLAGGTNLPLAGISVAGAVAGNVLTFNGNAPVWTAPGLGGVAAGALSLSSAWSNAMLFPPATGGGARSLQQLQFGNTPVRGLFLGDSMSELGNAGLPSAGYQMAQNLRLTYGDVGVSLNGFDTSYGNPACWNSSRPEDPHFFSGNEDAVVYSSDGTNAVRALQVISPLGSVAMVTQVGVYWMQGPLGGKIAVGHTSSTLGAETIYLDGFYSGPARVAFTNWSCPAASDNALYFTSLTGTNVFLGGEFINPHARGFLPLPYARGGSSLLGTLGPGTNNVATLFTAMAPDFAIWHAKDYYEESNAALSNSLYLVLSYTQLAKGTNTAVLIVGTPPNTIPGPGDTSISQNLIESTIAYNNANVGWYYVDLYSQFPNFQAMEASGVMQPGGPHPAPGIGTTAWANSLTSLMGLGSPGQSGGLILGNGAGLTNLPLSSISPGGAANGQIPVVTNGTLTWAAPPQTLLSLPIMAGPAVQALTGGNLYYEGIYAGDWNTNQGSFPIVVPVNCTVVGYWLTVHVGAGGATNPVSVALLSAGGAFGSNWMRWPVGAGTSKTNFTGLTHPLAAGATLELQIGLPAWSNPPTGVVLGGGILTTVP